MKRAVISLLLVFFCGASAKEALITNSAGKTLKVEFLDYEEGKLSFLSLSNRKRYELPMTDLDKDSQDAVKAWVKEGGNLSTRFEVEYSSGKRDRKENTAYYYDDNELTLEPKITVTNNFGNKKTRPVKMIVYTLGRPVVKKDRIYVFSREKFDVPSIDPKKSQVFLGKEIETKYNESKYDPHGAKYIGYAIFLISNKETIFSKYLPKTVETKYGESLLEAREEETVKPSL